MKKDNNMEKIGLTHMTLGNHRLTAAFEVCELAEGATVAHVAVSFCSPGDQFNRKIGRAISEGRLKAGKTFCTVDIDPAVSAKLQVRSFIEKAYELEYEGLPRGYRQSQLNA